MQPMITLSPACLASARGRFCPYHNLHMGYYLLEYALIDDYLARRAAFREAHLALARGAHRRGDLISPAPRRTA